MDNDMYHSRYRLPFFSFCTCTFKVLGWLQCKHLAGVLLVPSAITPNRYTTRVCKDGLHDDLAMLAKSLSTHLYFFTRRKNHATHTPW